MHCSFLSRKTLWSRAFDKYLALGGQNAPSVKTLNKILQPPIGGLGGSGVPLTSPPSSHLVGLSKSVKIMRHLVLYSLYCLISNNNTNTKIAKGCAMAMADPLDLGHGKNIFFSLQFCFISKYGKYIKMFSNYSKLPVVLHVSHQIVQLCLPKYFSQFLILQWCVFTI